MNRRRYLGLIGSAGLGVGAAAMMAAPAAPAMAAAPADPFGKRAPYPPRGPSRLAQRSYSGKVLYVSDGLGEEGREIFTVTIQPNGQRTMRAQVEMDNHQLLRDSVLTVDKDFHPVDAFVRTVVNGEVVGSTWYNFTELTAECEGNTAVEGRLSQKYVDKQRINMFSCHPIHCDAWIWASVRNKPDLSPYPWYNVSLSPDGNGSTGPTLIKMKPVPNLVRDMGMETVVTPAGTFSSRHFQFGRQGSTPPPLNTWVYGEDCVPVRLRSEGHKQTFELVELTGAVK